MAEEREARCAANRNRISPTICRFCDATFEPDTRDRAARAECQACRPELLVCCAFHRTGGGPAIACGDTPDVLCRECRRRPATEARLPLCARCADFLEHDAGEHDDYPRGECASCPTTVGMVA
jgi:hypothetical protein